VAFAIMTVFATFSENNYGVEFFVESEPEQATAYVRARGNTSLMEEDEMVRLTEQVILSHPAVVNVFSFAGEGGLNTDASGAQTPPDTIGQVQFEIIPWEDRPTQTESWFNGWFTREVTATEFDGDTVIDEINAELAELPGFEAEIRALAQGPASGKPVHLRIKGDNWETLTAATAQARAKFEATPGLDLIEDSLPLPGIDWQIDVDVEKAGRYGADVATVGAMVQLVTRGILLDTMRVDSSDEEIEIRVRLPEEDRVLSTLDALKLRTEDGLVPLSNFITRQPVPKLAEINRVQQQRYYDVKADIEAAVAKVVAPNPDSGTDETLAYVKLDADGPLTSSSGMQLSLFQLEQAQDTEALKEALADGARVVVLNPNERIAKLTEWLETSPFPADITWEWTGDQEEQAESGAFLSKAFAGALALMFVILLAQFNSFYNSILVLLAVVLSTTGVLIGMMVMKQPFSIIMTGTGIVALAGIVVNNNIVLIDTYQEFARKMPRIEAIIRTAEARIRPVLLTTITTMAGLAPMMFGLSLDFINGGYSIDSPTSLWWKQLATAVVFGLGIATVLTLLVTPSLLAIRVWLWIYVAALGRLFARLTGGRSSRIARDMRLATKARTLPTTEILWEREGRLDNESKEEADAEAPANPSLRAAE
jgi:multidrug efflux pump